MTESINKIKPISGREVKQTNGRLETGNQDLNAVLVEWFTLFREIVAIPSESDISLMQPKIDKIKNFFQQEAFKGIGIEFRQVNGVDRGPLEILIPEYNPDGQAFKPIIYFCHGDTVTPGIGIDAEIVEDSDGLKVRSRTHPELKNEEQPICGIDNQGPLVAALVVLKWMVENQIPHPRMRVVITFDEEKVSQEIRQVPKGDETIAVGFDKSGPLGKIVIESGGYTGVEMRVNNLTDRQFLELLVRFDDRLGSHLLARRRGSHSPITDVLQGRLFSINAMRLGGGI